MKVKLLRKIRKSYTITHYPNGCFVWGDFCKGPITILEDKGNSWRFELSSLEKKEAYNKLYIKLLKWIEKDYGPFKSKKKKITSEVLWYNTNKK